MNEIKIGNQIWAARNCDIVVPGSYSVNDDPDYDAKYGRLYTWDAAVSIKIPGWRLPTDDDWNILIKFCGEDAGRKLKSIDWSGTDTFEFNALPAGFRSSDGSFYSLGSFAHFWSASEYDASSVWDCYLYSGSDDVFRYYYHKTNGYSVRLIKDV